MSANVLTVSAVLLFAAAIAAYFDRAHWRLYKGVQGIAGMGLGVVMALSLKTLATAWLLLPAFFVVVGAMMLAVAIAARSAQTASVP